MDGISGKVWTGLRLKRFEELNADLPAQNLEGESVKETSGKLNLRRLKLPPKSEVCEQDDWLMGVQ